jgi:diguanylate cyclase (GGDEF)-like protein
VASAPQDRGLVHELQRSHRFTILVLGGMLVLSLVTSGYLILVSQSRLSHNIAMVREARDAREAMVDQETGLRGWLATGDRSFLEPYVTGRRAAERGYDRLLEEVERSPELTGTVVEVLLARQRWDVWAFQASGKRIGPRPADRAQLTTFLRQGKTLFDDYRTADVASTRVMQLRRDNDVRRQAGALSVVFLSYLVVLIGAGAVTLRRRRRLRSSILEPIDRLLETIGGLRAGDLSGRTAVSGVPELDQIGAAVNGLAGELDEARREAMARERRLVLLAQRFETVVTVGREISGSLSIRYVSRAVTTAAADLLGTPTTLWVRGKSPDFTATDRSQDAHGTAPPPDLVAAEAVAMAAAEARPVDAGGRRAYPLVLAGMVVAVLDSAATTVDRDTEQVLTALLATAAAALESAHLHSAARELADIDGLTQLPNRRRFEVDIDGEWERCRRYGRPLSVVMLDLDHFKRLNDEHGHLLGDQVLREVATAVNAVLRSTDTAYRYGGEELVVLLRETGLEDAASAAERLRRAVADLHITGYQVSVTTSAGVATRQASMSHYTELIEVADRALYAAKRHGRDQVVADAAAPTASAPTASALDAAVRGS